MTARGKGALERMIRAAAPGAWGEWRRQAACAEPEYAEVDFFPAYGPGYGQAVAAAKRVCAACPVRGECLDGHLREQYGVFGGLDEDERRSHAPRVRDRRAS